MRDTLEILENLPIGKNTPYRQLQLISTYCSIIDYAEGSTIYSEDVEFPYVGIIIDGKVGYYSSDIESDKKIRIGSYKKYPVGMFNFLELKHQNFSIKATEKTKILAIKYSDLAEIERQVPSFTIKFYKAMIKLGLQITKRFASIIVKLANEKENKKHKV